MCQHVVTVLPLLQADSAPDVWLQLLEHCAAEPDCQPTALRSLAQQLAEQKALTAQLRQQVLDQHEQLGDLQGLLQELRATVQQLLPFQRQ